ncbi:MAG: hypothetical protein HY220_01670 [Candidatus Sungbacteria bacterium]|uniref:Type II secretion system protein GspG C-terminal domain-containing protein n=1 Tax=Candidatus Sungiibacteriota bacterium TaxID=2750080 RepID=A0A9D6LQY9_9BACT|nr:hypothetical protein [Candidatus Sungbacteria bacterium]
MWGFTFIELLVIIAIIGLLTTIVLASLDKARIKSRDAQRVSDIRRIQLALQLYYDAGLGANQTNLYPTSGGLGANFTPTVLQTNGLLTQTPTDPKTGNQYRYSAWPQTSPIYYHLGASMEDSGGPEMGNDIDMEYQANDAWNYVDGKTSQPDCAVGGGTDICYDVIN